MPLNKGQVLQNRYRIVTLLGQGGMGAVYRAWDLNLSIPVAIKENLDSSPAAQRQFSYEANILARLSHPNLTRVTDYFFIQGQGQYLVMDFVEGEDLESMANRQGALPETKVLPWILQVCDALDYLHHQSSPIIHRDIKPANIKIRPDGQVILVDFGIAKIYDVHQATTMGAKAVTPGYSPPEQYGGAITDPRSDIYAVGATLYRLLTGQPLPESIARSVGSATVLPPRQLNPQIQPATEKAILRSIELAAGRRFQNAADLISALTIQALPPVTVPPVERTIVQPVYNVGGSVYAPPQSATPNVMAPLPISVPPAYQPNARPKWLFWVGGGSIALCGLAVLLILLGNYAKNIFSPANSATPHPTRTPSILPSATPVPSPTPLPLVGSWVLNYDWGCTGTMNSIGITFNSEHTFILTDGSPGTWSLEGTDLTFTFDNGTVYSGQYSRKEISGTMIDTSNETGCWTITAGTYVPSPTPPEVSGDWSMSYDWSCDGGSNTMTITFVSDYTFTDSESNYGEWSRDGSEITIVFSVGATYTGQVNDNEMSGTMVDNSGSTGCWTATRK